MEKRIMKFTHLHVHSHYSVLDGMSKVPDLVDKAIKLGMPAIALTDHGCMYGIKELLDYCKKANKKLKEKAAEEGTEYVPFKPIVGVEAYCARRSRLLHDKELKAVNAEGKSYIVDQSGWHLILLAKNMQGYRNLCKIVSASFMEDSYYRRPRIDKELLEQYHEGLICCSACLGGELPQKIMEGLANGENSDAFQAAEDTIKWYKNLFREDYYIEIQRHQTTKAGADQHVYQVQREVNPILVQLAKKHGVKIVATNDVHFVEEEHAEAHDHLVCVSTNHFIDDENRMHYTKQEWLKSPAQMEAIFSDIPEALENTQEIVDKVEIYDIDSGPLMPKFPIPEEFGTEESYRQKFTEKDLFEEFTRDENGNEVLTAEAAEKKVKTLGGYDRLYRIKLEADYLAHLAYKGAHERYGETLTEEQEERIKFELHIMKTMGFPGYFLIVMDFIRAAREELGVSVGPGRGSAAGSVVAYCLRITDLDPLKYDLLFERFLNPDRISLPDIDTDFDDAGRGRVLDWVSEKYGHTQVAHIITYGTMATKSAIADVGRVQRIPLARVNEIKGFIPDKFPDNITDDKGKSPKVNLKNCYKYVDDLRALLNGDEPQIRNMLTYAAQLEDTIRQVGVHACGVIIGADDLTKFAPLSTVEDKTTGKRVLVTEYDGHVVESVGLIKMDFLGLKTLTIIKECLKNIYKAHGVTIDIDHISIEDAETYKLFQEGRTVGVFQFESAGMRKYMKELKPTVMGDLIAMNALYRPGPMDYIPQFIRRKHGLEPVTYDIPVMEKYLKDTYGVTVYQEQVMLLSRLLANFTRGESDQLRKAMGKKILTMLAELKPKFINGGKSNGHDEKILEKIWADWEKFASYAFNKSHAACYSWVAYQTAYLKAHYPAEFMAANLTVAKDDIKDVTKFMDECKAMKISVLAPDVNESETNFTVNSKGDIRFGLGGVKGVGEGAVEAIIQEREKNGKYKDLFDFLERVNLQACNRKTVESLALAGAFDGFEGLYREQLFGSNAKGENMLEVVMRYGNRFQQDKQERSVSLFDGFDIGGIEVQRPELPVVPRWSAIERLNKEKDLIGIFLSAHPLDEWEFEVKELCNTTAEEMQQFEAWSSPAARASASTPNEDNAAEEEEEQKEKLTPNQWIEKHAGQPLHLGGIIMAAEDRVSQKGNPWGKYIIEDYTGSFQFSVFGEAYQRFASLLKPNMYVYLTGVIQQRGAQFKYFKPKPTEEAEYEFAVQQVQLIKEAQKDLRSITLQIPIENVQLDLIDELMDITKQYPGETSLRLEIFDTIRQNVITFNASPIQMSSNLYGQLKELQTDDVLEYKIN